MVEQRFEDDDRLIAGELALVLDDAGLWGQLGEAHIDEEATALAERAVRLYRLTSPILAKRVSEYATPASYAVGALRDVADNCAMLTGTWSREDRANLPISQRGDIEGIIRRFDVLEWANALGVELDLAEAERPEAEPTTEDPDGLSAHELAKRWGSTIRTFRTASRLRTADAKARADLQGPGLRPNLPATVALARYFLVWARQSSDHGVIAVAVTQLLAAQGFFVACWERDADGPLFPTDDYLHEFLTLEGGFEWLAQHDADVPAELRA